MANELVSSVIIGDDVQYEIYKLNDEDPDTKGNIRQELDIILLKEAVDLTTILSRYTAYYPDTYTSGISIQDTFDRILIKPGFYVKPTDENGTFLDQDNFKMDLDTIVNIGSVKKLIITNPASNELMNISCHLSAYQIDNSDGSITYKESPFTNITWIKFENCNFDSGLDIHDVTKIVAEYINCTFEKYMNVTNSKDSIVTCKMYLSLTNCTINNLRTLCINKLESCKISGLTINNPTANSTDTVSGYISPSLNIDNCTTVELSNIKIINILVGFKIDTCTNVSISNFTGCHVKAGSPLQTVLDIVSCTKVNVNGYKLNGLVVDLCKTVNISTIAVFKNTVVNAEFAVKVNRCTGDVSIADIKAEDTTVKTVITIAACSGTINVSGCTFENNTNGIYINTNESDVSISDCNFISCTDTPIRLVSLTGHTSIIDTTINNCEHAINAKSITDLELSGCAITGIAKAYKTSTDPDAIFMNCGTLSLTNSTTFKTSSMKIATCNTLDLSNISFSGSYINTSVITTVTIDKLFFDGLDISEKNKLMIDMGTSFTMTNSFIKNAYPLIQGYTTLNINTNKFQDGLHVTMSGDLSSNIYDNIFGNDTNAALYSKGLNCEYCTGIVTRKNTFYNSNKSTSISISLCKYMTIDERDTTYSAENSTIEITNGDINDNHIIIDLTKTNNAKLSNLASSYKYVLFNYNIAEYRKIYNDENDVIYNTMDKVFKLASNIISYINPENTWTNSYISYVKSALKSYVQS